MEERAVRLTFEVRETDLLGRIGELTVGSKRIETPCLFPVIHPVTRDIPLSQFRSMGFDALMTNSFIIYRRLRSEALEKGLHDLLGFDGLLMTDSGGYQVLEYGQVDLDPLTIADFQSRIGSDLAVTLDKPTGYSKSRKYAKDTVETSLRGAVETIGKYSDSDTTWVGPVQGGLFRDLVSSSTRALVEAGFSMLALGSPTELMENYLFDELVNMVIATKTNMPYSMPLHLFGAGHPLTLALSVALGCDTFDSASYILFAKQGRYMTDRGTLELKKMMYLPCSCPVCNSTSQSELVRMGRDERVVRLSLHNLHVLREELLKCKQALVEGRLWDLVEERASVHPSLAKAFARLTRWSKLLKVGTQMLKERGLLIRSRFDGRRPELLLARDHIDGSFTRRTRRAALIVSPENKPLLRMKAYQRILAMGGSNIDVYRLHRELALYPAELEFVYPFTQTIRSDERLSAGMVRKSVRRLRAMGYTTILLCGTDSVKRIGRPR